MKYISIKLAHMRPDPNQPRKSYDEADITALSKQQIHIPVIVFQEGDIYWLIDGYRRYLAMLKAQAEEMEALVLGSRPTPKELLLMQLRIDNHRKNFTLYERFLAMSKLLESNLSPSEIAKELEIAKSSVTRILSIGNLKPELQALVRDEKLSSAGAYALARMEEDKQQRAIEALADGSADRDMLESLARKNKKLAAKSANTRLILPGCTFTVQSQEALTLDGLLDTLHSVIKAVKKAKREGLDIRTMAHVMKAKSAQPAIATEVVVPYPATSEAQTQGAEA